ncbi:DUF2905 domain-containing protein [Thiomicrorhabdus sp. zzn3]|uniref:DUF2905 domain-containing protein n=1 Tax=Thiomicrorhabdus sp. zzn3 TaxID=3039775 RepID=UPI002436F510|nr:DUF2905 domain-containing protein [Thiomicrorhabdus sp. zzn3]MDG6778105.1 DUF2905 domain-containing protein [Thiomicrorhabdus sp. zzn3]
MASILILIGLLLVVIGVIVKWAPGLLSWFGQLPGDIHIQTARGELFIPFTSMILTSIAISLILNFFKR